MPAQRFMDEIDAVEAGSAWLTPIAQDVYRERPCNIETHRFSSSDGGVTLLWSGRELIASYIVVRDDANCSVLFQWSA